MTPFKKNSSLVFSEQQLAAMLHDNLRQEDIELLESEYFRLEEKLRSLQQGISNLSAIEHWIIRYFDGIVFTLSVMVTILMSFIFLTHTIFFTPHRSILSPSQLSQIDIHWVLFFKSVFVLAGSQAFMAWIVFGIKQRLAPLRKQWDYLVNEMQWGNANVIFRYKDKTNYANALKECGKVVNFEISPTDISDFQIAFSYSSSLLLSCLIAILFWLLTGHNPLTL
ncbi:MAG: hypothetical protein JNM36_18420 [Chitinophagales bacterium]|nr:hypothetical protein [Chitinophagales bacterium]HNI44809.1 hypothetical protein [Chitinophagales bacterium]HNL07572.1 hypothetical protein [Chitinophagales bacterium]